MTEQEERELQELRRAHLALQRQQDELRRSLREAEETAERERYSAEHFRQIFYLIPAMQVIMSFPERKILDINEAGLKAFGFERHEIIGRSPQELLMWEDPKAGDQTFEILKKTGELKNVEARIRRRDGAIITVLCNGRLLTVGERRCSIVALEDITARKKVEATLRESDERFRAAIHSLQEGFILQDHKSEIVLCNESAERILGISHEQMVGRTPLDPRWRATYEDGSHFPGEKHPSIIALRDGRASRGVIMGVDKPSGERVWASINSVPVDVNPPVVVTTFTDITEIKNAEKALRVSQKMEAIGTLASGIAHDFNNILGAISGYLELAKSDASQSPTILQSLEGLSKASERATSLVKQILTFSRQEEPQHQTIQLAPTIQEVIQLLRATLPSSITFRMQLSPGVSPVLANTTQIHQIIMNLSTNAAHAMRGAGQLTFTLENFAVKEELASKLSLKQGPYVRFSVEDTGHGIPQGIIDKIFDPFFTTKSLGEGTGLGLSVIHGIMKSSQGAITVRSQPGEGTIFCLYFPAFAGQAPQVPTARVQIPRGNGERILFVDDEELLGRPIKAMLERLGYLVDIETQAKMAVVAVRANPDLYRLVITDLTMPDMLGTELAAKLLQIKPGLSILLISGNSSDLKDTSIQEIGIRELLQKPISIARLGEAIHKALQPSTD